MIITEDMRRRMTAEMLRAVGRQVARLAMSAADVLETLATVSEDRTKLLHENYELRAMRDDALATCEQLQREVKREAGHRRRR